MQAVLGSLIKDMPPLGLWARPDTIGSSNEEAEAMTRNEVSRERIAELIEVQRQTIRWLFHLPTQGRPS